MTRHYWTIKQHNEVLFTGTFIECWNRFVTEYGDMIISEAAQAGYRITRAK